MSLTTAALLTTGLLLAAFASPARASGAGEKTRAQLARLAEHSHFFAHQSVGQNLMEGLALLASDSGAEVAFVATSDPALVRKGSFAHAPVGQNGDPIGKIADFARIMNAGMGKVVDVAFLKFCYVDINADTDVAAVFAKYQSTFRDLRAAYPGVTFVHLTVPLMTADSQARALAKRVLGRGNRLAENARREAYNQLVRRAYSGKEPLFDLARAESTWPDGRREAASWKGTEVPLLVPQYSSDGGHLNRTGSRILAGQLASVLASVR